MTITTEELTPEQISTIATLQLKLSSLGVDGHFLKSASVGPVVTMYKFAPTNATRISLVERVAQDLALALGVEAVQVRRLPRETSVGIYIPNKERKLLSFKNCVNTVWTSKAEVPILLGMNHDGEVVVSDLTLLPHLLIAGSTGGGKSTLLNSILASLMYCRKPNQIQLVLCDTKQVEFTHFKGAPHLLFPPAMTVFQVIDQLNWVIEEMEDRLKTIGKSGVQNILEYNKNHEVKIPYIVFVIDELAELLMCRIKPEESKITIAKMAEDRLALIAQKARASGIYLIAATQRPSVKVVEGNIKSNFPARISFRLPSEADSRTILTRGGAENLLARGDMLFLNPNSPIVERLHAPFTNIEDIKAAVDMACRRVNEQ